MRAEITISEGETTTYNFGDDNGVTVAGYVTPEPSNMGIGIVVLRIPGVPLDLSALDLRNPVSFFGGGSIATIGIAGATALESYGDFTLNNVLPGEYILEVYFANLLEVIGGSIPTPVLSEDIVVGEED